MTQQIRHREVYFTADDGLRIGGTHWHGATAEHGVVVIATATGVHHRFYRRFAEYLAQHGFEAMAFDWRGMGASRTPRGHRDPRLTMRNWGERDLTAAIAWADRQAEGRPVHLVGHSFGGQALGLAPNAARVRRAVFVGAQHGWMGHWPLRLRVPLWWLWRMAMPVGATVLGRFPSRLLGMGETLPKGVAAQWARWCARPEHMGTWGGHAALRLPMLALSFEDDAFAPERAAAALLRQYAQASVTHEHHPATGLGHFGYFRGGQALPLWERTQRFLAAA
jgi:predicted alpha/beta hydrolase